MAQLVEITLDGQKYKLRADDPFDSIQKAAQLVDQQLLQVREKTKASSPYQLALLAALNVALRYQKLCSEVEAFKTSTSSELKGMIRIMEEAQSSTNAV